MVKTAAILFGLVFLLVGILGFEMVRSSDGRPTGVLTAALADMLGQPVTTKK